MAPGLSCSVVLPTYGRRASVLRVLEALGRQTLPAAAFEVLVICDGDVDGSVAACRALAERMPYTLRVFEQPNQGPAAARNRGVKEANAALIVFIDDDVIPATSLLQAHVEAHRAGDGLVSIGPLLPPPDRRLSLWCAWEEESLCRQYAAMMAGCWSATYRQFYTGNAAVRRQHILAAGGFDSAYLRAEDVELALRLAGRGLEFAFLPQARAWHYVQRSFTAWLRVAAAYGATEVAMARAGHPRLLDLVAREFRSRHWTVRWLAGLCAGRARVAPAAQLLLGLAVRLAERLRVRSLGMRTCSLLFNLQYYHSMALALGGRSRWQLLLSGAGGASLLPGEPAIR